MDRLLSTAALAVALTAFSSCDLLQELRPNAEDLTLKQDLSPQLAEVDGLSDELKLQWTTVDGALADLETEVDAFASQPLDESRFNYALVMDAIVNGIDGVMVDGDLSQAYLNASEPLAAAIAEVDQETRDLVSGLLASGGMIYSRLDQELPVAIAASLEGAVAMKLDLDKVSRTSEELLSVGRDNPLMTPADKEQLEKDYVTLTSKVEGLDSYRAQMTQTADNYSSRLKAALNKFRGRLRLSH